MTSRFRTTALTAIVLVAACEAAPDSPTSVVSPAEAPLTIAPDQGAAAEAVVPGHVLVRLQPNADLAEVAGRHGLQVAANHARFSIVRGAAGNERALAARLRAEAEVEFAEPDFLRQPTAIDPRLWAFYNPGGLEIRYTRGGNRGQVVSSKISTADADEDNIEGYGAGGAAVVIGSIDTGVDFAHGEFLSGQLIKGSDWIDGDGSPDDEDDHGTHTTGTMVGQSVGVAGVSGAGANVQVLVQRVCGNRGCPSSAIANAINEAADYPGMVAMNLSLGGGSLSQAERDAIQYATNKGVLVIASAGNDGTGTVSCPACDPNAISVAASNWQDGRAYYSNWGSGLDITAPGGELYSNTTDEGGIYSAVRGGYGYLQGTSMAAPQVTGTAAVVASVAGLTGPALRARLEGTVDDLGQSGYDTDYGHGRLNSYRAVTTQTLVEGGPPGGSLTASIDRSCSRGDCTFDGSGSTGPITSYAWTLSDGSSASGVTASETYTAAGSYTVSLTVSDGSGNTDSASRTITCTARGKNNKLSCS